MEQPRKNRHIKNQFGKISRCKRTMEGDDQALGQGMKLLLICRVSDLSHEVQLDGMQVRKLSYGLE
jgi:hypothetical protein